MKASLGAMALLQPSRIRVLAIGKVKRPWLAEGIAFYAKRLPGLEVVMDVAVQPAILPAFPPPRRRIPFPHEFRKFSVRIVLQRLISMR